MRRNCMLDAYSLPDVTISETWEDLENVMAIALFVLQRQFL